MSHAPTQQASLLTLPRAPASPPEAAAPEHAPARHSARAPEPPAASPLGAAPTLQDTPAPRASAALEAEPAVAAQELSRKLARALVILAAVLAMLLLSDLAQAGPSAEVGGSTGAAVRETCGESITPRV